MTKSKPQKIIIIVGPTASGKSDLAIKIARKYAGEIISADSRQVYRGMDIGTGKVPRDIIPKLEILNPKQYQNSKLKTQNREYYSSGIKHYLIDVANPEKQFTADDFKKLGKRAIEEIAKKNKIPIIAGGTGFYIDILLGRMNYAEVPANPKLRAKLENQSAEQLFKRLVRLDPARAKIIDRHNKRRLIRALEIVLATGKPVPYSKFEIRNSKFNTLWLGINLGKEILAEKIKKRLDSRLKQGMIKEVQELHRKGVSWKRLDNFGLEYRWLSRWLVQNLKIKNQNDNLKFKSFMNSEEYKNLLRGIVKYSKRQITWFKKNKEIEWIRTYREAELSAKRFIDR